MDLRDHGLVPAFAKEYFCDHNISFQSRLAHFGHLQDVFSQLFSSKFDDSKVHLEGFVMRNALVILEIGLGLLVEVKN